MGTDNLDIFVKMSAQLGSIDSSIKTLCARIADHENRLSQLEKGASGYSKDQIISLLIKCLIIAGVSLASLTGAGPLLKQILGN